MKEYLVYYLLNIPSEKIEQTIQTFSLYNLLNKLHLNKEISSLSCERCDGTIESRLKGEEDLLKLDLHNFVEKVFYSKIFETEYKKSTNGFIHLQAYESLQQGSRALSICTDRSFQDTVSSFWFYLQQKRTAGLSSRDFKRGEVVKKMFEEKEVFVDNAFLFDLIGLETLMGFQDPQIGEFVQIGDARLNISKYAEGEKEVNQMLSLDYWYPLFGDSKPTKCGFEKILTPSSSSSLKAFKTRSVLDIGREDNQQMEKEIIKKLDQIKGVKEKKIGLGPTAGKRRMKAKMKKKNEKKK